MPNERDEKENEIVNRHTIAMVEELQKSGFDAEAAVVFVAFEGSNKFNIATLLHGRLPKGMSAEQVRLALLEYAHDEICKLIDELDPEDTPSGTRH